MFVLSHTPMLVFLMFFHLSFSVVSEIVPEIEIDPDVELLDKL